MPNITAAGTYTKNDPGFQDLDYVGLKRQLLFSGSSIGTSCQVQYRDDTNSPQLIEGGDITSLPKSFEVAIKCPIEINVTGTPNLNLTIKT